VPTGLAQNLYDSLATLQYEGSVTLTEQECVGDIRPGHLLRLSGGRTAWATMDAMVFETVENISAGETAVRFGPPAHLVLADWLALVRLGRDRVVYTRPEQVTTSEEVGQGGEAQLGSGTALQNSTHLHSPGDMINFRGTSHQGEGAEKAQIILATADLPAGETVRLREFIVCRDDTYPPLKFRVYIPSTPGVPFVGD
jgi:hypothetical protein